MIKHIILSIGLVLTSWSVVVGQCTTCEYSLSRSGSDFADIVWTGSQYVAVGKLIFTSPDAINWQPHQGFLLPEFTRIIWNGQKLLAWNNGIIGISSDGKGWRVRQLEGIEEVQWTGQKFLARGRQSLLASSDGEVWTETGPALEPESFFSLLRADGQRVFLQAVGNLWISHDGAQSWTAYPTSTYFYDMAFSPSRMVAISSSKILTSLNGISWEEVSQAGLIREAKLLWAEGRFLIINADRSVFTSTDGLTWSLFPDLNYQGTVGLWDGSRFLIGGFKGELYESVLGQIWTLVGQEPMEDLLTGISKGNVSLAAANSLYRREGNGIWQDTGITFDSRICKFTIWHNQFIAGSIDGFIYLSEDGWDWKKIQTGSSLCLNGFFANDQILLAVTGGTLLSSEDALSWTPVVTPKAVLSGVWNGVEFLAVGRGNVMTSPDGKNWTLHYAPSVRDFRSIVWRDGYYAIDGNLYFSSDGKNWVYVLVPRTKHWQYTHLINAEGMLAAHARQGGLVVSSDPLFWKSLPQGAGLFSRDLIWNGSQFTVFDSSGRTIDWKNCSSSIDQCDLSNRLLIPWVVNNVSWESRIAISNFDSWPVTIQCLATTSEGLTQSKLISIPANSVQAMAAVELFPNLSGYSLEILSRNQVFGSFLTFNREPQSGGSSPSQATTLAIRDLTSKLSFGYLPGEEISAIVLVAPDGSGETPVQLALYDTDGGVVAETLTMLQNNQPMALLVSELFGVNPPHGAVIATSENGTLIGGTTFVFNQLHQPSMSTALPIR